LCPTEGGGDGRTETYTDCPERTSGHYANEAAQGRGGTVNDVKGVIASCSESAPCEHGARIAGGIVLGWAAEAVEGVDDLVSVAKKLYPNKANKNEKHHIIPKYAGGDPKGATISINAAYHQVITNLFRELLPYGSAKLNGSELTDLLSKVYSKLPLPSGQ
jgi:hypothetical protein